MFDYLATWINATPLHHEYAFLLRALTTAIRRQYHLPTIYHRLDDGAERSARLACLVSLLRLDNNVRFVDARWLVAKMAGLIASQQAGNVILTVILSVHGQRWVGMLGRNGVENAINLL